MLFRKYSGIVFACGIQTYTSSIYPISGALSHIKAAKAVGKRKEGEGVQTWRCLTHVELHSWPYAKCGSNKPEGIVHRAITWCTCHTSAGGRGPSVYVCPLFPPFLSKMPQFIFLIATHKSNVHKNAGQMGKFLNKNLCCILCGAL